MLFHKNKHNNIIVPMDQRTVIVPLEDFFESLSLIHNATGHNKNTNLHKEVSSAPSYDQA